MKKLLMPLAAILLFTHVAIANVTEHDQPKSTRDPVAMLPLIPYPKFVERHQGKLQLADQANLAVPDKAENAGRALRQLLSNAKINVSAQSGTAVELVLVESAALGDEGYRLVIDDGIRLEAQTDTGLFYGVQTLRQLLPIEVQGAYALPKLEIVDTPEFAWRGTMLDVARSFLPISYLEAHIDRMALFKLNRLHLHLSDDQGWRVEIKSHPRLTGIGGASAVEGGRSGFYTQWELRDLVTYGEARGVTIVPEIDLPGHTQAAIASYNELACQGVTNLSTYSGVEVGFSKLCLDQPDVTYPFVEAVLAEIADIFPSEYIHIGGDEIKDPLYAEFISRATKIVADLGRTAVAWEEGSVAEMDNNVLLQLWNDEYDIQPALERGHQLILSPCSFTYFDHGNYDGQPDTYTWCRKEGVPLERAYSLDPQSFKQIHGVESAMWSELVHTDETADNRLWPRVIATAELGWSPKSVRDYEGFLGRLDALRPQLDALDIHYYRLPELDW